MAYDEELADRLRLLAAGRGWLRVDAAAVEDDPVLNAWAERGLAYAGSLPTT